MLGKTVKLEWNLVFNVNLNVLSYSDPRKVSGFIEPGGTSHATGAFQLRRNGREEVPNAETFGLIF